MIWNVKLRWSQNINRPFPSSKKSHFQNEAKCEIFVVKMSFICIIIKNHFHINGFALSLALKVRFFGTRKWPIKVTPALLYFSEESVRSWRSWCKEENHMGLYEEITKLGCTR